MASVANSWPLSFQLSVVIDVRLKLPREVFLMAECWLKLANRKVVVSMSTTIKTEFGSDKTLLSHPLHVTSPSG